MVFPLQNRSLSLVVGFLVLAVVLSREIFEGGKAVAARHVLLEFLLQGFETDAVLLVGPELGDVEAGGVRHVDHVGIGQHDELIFLEDESSVSICEDPREGMLDVQLHDQMTKWMNEEGNDISREGVMKTEPCWRGTVQGSLHGSGQVTELLNTLVFSSIK